MDDYARILIGKNFRHTFSNILLDHLNYFKLKEYVETDRVHEFENIKSEKEYKTFIEKRKPKRGRKLTLATACAVCLSDYFEASNPLISCSTCILRVHKLCFPLQDKKCGSCSFQKL